MKTASLILANLLLVATVVIYLRNVVKNGVTPNPAAFFIRSVVAVMNCFSYFAVLHKDYFKLSVSIVSTLGLVIIFIYALMRGRLTKLRTVDVVCGLTATAIGVVWKTTGNPILANLLLQSIMLLAFYPALSGVLSGIAKEKAFPWVLASSCYVFMVLAIIWDWNSGSWYALVHPVVSGFLGNGSLAIAIWWHNRKARRAV